ncbi:hypothetical protein [Slackia heliotrinireducens]|nr:hypothetical protein [Slackia heliotrinireducens]
MCYATDEFIKPLYDEITALNPDYATYTLADMFAYLVQLDNELMLDDERETIGDELMLDFGNNMWANVHAGADLGSWEKIKTDKGLEAVYYAPRFVADLHHNRHPIFPGYDRGNVAVFLAEEREAYEALPVPYKVALLSLYVAQNIVTSLEWATHRVAACGKYLKSSGRLSPGARVTARYWLGGDGRYKGWELRIRDTKPPKEWFIDLSRYLRENTTAIDDCYGENAMTNKPAKEKKPRSNQGRTDTLVAFVHDILPARGKRPGKDGYTWEMARNDFWDEYPEYQDFYGTDKKGIAFSKAYREALKRREGR